MDPLGFFDGIPAAAFYEDEDYLIDEPIG